jgi:hypothetical protein
VVARFAHLPTRGFERRERRVCQPAVEHTTFHWVVRSLVTRTICNHTPSHPPRALHTGKIANPAPEMKKLRMIVASELLTTARVVAHPSPSLPPCVLYPQ